MRGNAVFVALSACLVYSNSLWGELVFDDLPAIVRNQDVTNMNQPLRALFFHDFWGTPITYSISNKSYRPITVLTFRLNYSLHGLKPFGYHLVNVILHAFCSVLFQRLFLHLLLLSQDIGSIENYADIYDKAELQASAGALLFATHPVHCEAVASIVGRAEILAAVCVLSAILAYLPPLLESSFRRDWLRVTLCIFFTVCGVLCKEQAIAALPICIFIEGGLLSLRRTSISKNKKQQLAISSWSGVFYFKAVRRAFILGVAFIVISLLRFWIMGTHQGGRKLRMSESNNPAAHAPERLTRLLTYHYLLPVNAGKLIYPALNNLCCDWSRGSIPLVSSLSDARNLATGLFWAAFLYQMYTQFLLLRSCTPSNRRGLCLPTFAALLLLIFPFIPASNLFFPVGFVVAERVLYTPSMGFCLGTAMSLTEGITFRMTRGKIAVDDQTRSRNGRIKPIIYFLLITFYCSTTIRRNLDWRTSERLWQSGVKINPQNGLLWTNLGHDLEDRAQLTSSGREALLQRAWGAFETAYRLDPLANDAVIMMGIMALRNNQVELARSKFEQAVKAPNPSAIAHYNYALTYLLVSNPFKEKQERDHNDEHYHENGDTAEKNEILEAHAAVSSEVLEPSTSISTSRVASVIEKQKLENAAKHLKYAVQVDPMLVSAVEMLSDVLAQLGRYDDAIEALAASFRRNPSVPLLHKLQELSKKKKREPIDKISTAEKNIPKMGYRNEFLDMSIAECEAEESIWEVVNAEYCYALHVRKYPRHTSGLIAYSRFLATKSLPLIMQENAPNDDPRHASGERRYDEALALLKRAERLEPQNPEPSILICNVLRLRDGEGPFSLGKVEDCLRAAAAAHDHPVAYHNLAALLEQTGREGEATKVRKSASMIRDARRHSEL